MNKSLLTLSLFLSFLVGSLSFGAGVSPKESSTQAVKKDASSYYNEAFLSQHFASHFVSWGIDPAKSLSSINLKKSLMNFKKGQDIVVAVIDTGIQYDHPFLKNNVVIKQTGKHPKTKEIVSYFTKANKKNFGIDYSSKSKVSNTPFDSHGHGTHVSGIIKSVFPEVKLLSVKYYNPQASGQDNLNATIKSLKYAIDAGVDIINYSGGGPEPSKEELELLKLAEKKGILIIAAAGNEKSNIDNRKNAYYPASYGLPNIITVGAHDEKLKIIASSNFGKNSVDIAAPGYQIKSAIPTNGSGYLTGTSQATAFVSGVAALIKAKYPKMNYDQIRNIIIGSSLKIKNFEGKILGAGKLDATRALQLADSANLRIAKLKSKRNRSMAKAQ